MNKWIFLIFALSVGPVCIARQVPSNQEPSKRQPSKPADSAATVDPRIASWLSRQDKNQDGKVSLAESTGLMKANFARIDSNQDGFLEQKELAGLSQRLARGRKPNQVLVSDERILKQVPDGVSVRLNLAYRQGNDAWRLDLAMPKSKSDTPRPAIVFVHGGGWTKGDKRSNLFIGQALKFASQGYVCVSVNYRLDSAKLPCIEDVKCAVRWLRAHATEYNLDPKRIGAYGNSAGAHLVVMLGLSNSEKKLEGDGPWEEFSSGVQAVAASATPTRPSLRNGSEEARKLIAPMSYVDANAPPMLLFHEVSDRIVDVSNSDDLVQALRESGAKDIQYERYTDGSGHAVFSRNLNKTQPMMARFFENTIGDSKH